MPRTWSFPAWPSTHGALHCPCDCALRRRASDDANLNIDGLAGSISGVYPRILRAWAPRGVNRLNVMLQTGERGIPAKREVTSLFGEWFPGRTVRRKPDRPALSDLDRPSNRSTLLGSTDCLVV